MEENLSGIFEYEFNFARYIEGRLREIDDLEERRFAKALLLEGLGEVINSSEEKYHRLEEQIFDSIAVSGNSYEIRSTVIKRGDYDPGNRTLFPVCPTDLNREILAENLKQGAGNSCYYGMTVYFKLSDQKLAALEQSERVFPGIIEWKGKQNLVKARIKACRRYRNAVEQLYRVFCDNHVLWETVNTAHLDRCYDVYLEFGQLKTGAVAPEWKEWKITIDFEELEEFSIADCLPLWNVEQIKFRSREFVQPSYETLVYEHEFRMENFSKGDGCLIEKVEDILELRREKGKILMKSYEKTFMDWTAYRVAQNAAKRSAGYQEPVLTNHKKDSFLRRYAEKSGISLQTKADLFRKITEQDIGDYIEIRGYKIAGWQEEYPPDQNMNWFIPEGLLPLKSRKVLLFLFREKTPGYFLNESMVRFVVTQIQRSAGEFYCVGMMEQTAEGS